MNKDNGVLTGIVTSRDCPACGHHELGLVTEEGGFHPLKPGMAIRIIGPEGMINPSIQEGPDREILPAEEVADHSPWMPDPAISHRKHRQKYGVRVRSDLMSKPMTPEIYRAAYLDKLEELIEKELYVPLAVILDRFFTAPHLASGNPRQIAEAMWRELKEVREPVRRVEEWLASGDPSIFTEKTGKDDSKERIAGEYPGTESVLEELRELSLEEFLGLL